MNQQKLIPIALILLMPFHVLAHGEEALVPLIGQFISVVFFLFFVFLFKAKKGERLRLIVVYFSTLFIVLFSTSNMPYLKNERILNYIYILGPALTTLIYFVIQRRKSA
jgi:hypothetical protein